MSNTTDLAGMITTAADPERLAAYVAMLDQVQSNEDLLGLIVCAVTEQVVANARAAGIERPNANAVMHAAIQHVLAGWQADDPKRWFAYLAEIGVDPQG